jgi:glycosidase
MHQNGGWSAVYFENHDLARSVSRFLGFRSEADSVDGKGSLSLADEVERTRHLRARGAKLLAILQTTQGGTLYVYQGQELGLANVPSHWPIEEYKDVATVNFYNEFVGAFNA